MYYILLVEVLTTAFMDLPGVLDVMGEQPKNTLKAMFHEPGAGLDTMLKYYFEAAVIVEEQFCKPLRQLSADSKMTQAAFKEECQQILDRLEIACADNDVGMTAREALWRDGQVKMGARIDANVATANARRDKDKPLRPDFVPGAFKQARAAREAHYPGSGDRDMIFLASLKGLVAALRRNILYAVERRDELDKFSDEQLSTFALNNTLLVESIFSHMRRRHDGSHSERGPLSEAVILTKLEPVSLEDPPRFLPRHIRTPEAIRREGRDAQAGYGGRRVRGRAALARAIEKGKARVANVARLEASAANKIAQAEETSGAVVYEDEGAEEPTHRELAAGERLTGEHLTKMGRFIGPWLDGVKVGQRALKWTQQRIEYQLVLVNTVTKSSRLIERLGKCDFFRRNGKPILVKPGDRLATGPGKDGRAGQLSRLLAFVAIEGGLSSAPREADSMTQADCDWRAWTVTEITAQVNKKSKTNKGKGKEAEGSEVPAAMEEEAVDGFADVADATMLDLGRRCLQREGSEREGPEDEGAGSGSSKRKGNSSDSKAVAVKGGKKTKRSKGAGRSKAKGAAGGGPNTGAAGTKRGVSSDSDHMASTSDGKRQRAPPPPRTPSGTSAAADDSDSMFAGYNVLQHSDTGATAITTGTEETPATEHRPGRTGGKTTKAAPATSAGAPRTSSRATKGQNKARS